MGLEPGRSDLFVGDRADINMDSADGCLSVTNSVAIGAYVTRETLGDALEPRQGGFWV